MTIAFIEREEKHWPCREDATSDARGGPAERLELSAVGGNPSWTKGLGWTYWIAPPELALCGWFFDGAYDPLRGAAFPGPGFPTALRNPGT